MPFPVLSFQKVPRGTSSDEPPLLYHTFLKSSLTMKLCLILVWWIEWSHSGSMGENIIKLSLHANWMSRCSAQLLCLKSGKPFIDSMGKWSRIISKVFSINTDPRDNCVGGQSVRRDKAMQEFGGFNINLNNPTAFSEWCGQGNWFLVLVGLIELQIY